LGLPEFRKLSHCIAPDNDNMIFRHIHHTAVDNRAVAFHHRLNHERLTMDRITITIEPDLLAGLDAFVADKGYAGRSEALRDMLRERLQSESTGRDGDGQCIAALTYVYDHHKRQLSNRLTDLHHDHHDLTIATLHVHLDHDSCLEVAILRGDIEQVRKLAGGVICQSGVRYGHTHVVPVSIAMQSHHHHDEQSTVHTHSHDGAQAHEHIRTLVWNTKP